MNYILKFQTHWEHPQLVRYGGQHSPLERELRIVENDQYGNMDYDRSDDEDRPTYDFVVNQAGYIIPNLSDGLSTYTEERFFPENFTIEKERMWKLENVTTYEEPPPIGLMNYDLMYPDEMELKRDPRDQNHFGIKPARDVYVKPPKFRQMLRCLPWMKIYTYGAVKEAKEKEANEKKKAKEKQKHN